MSDIAAPAPAPIEGGTAEGQPTDQAPAPKKPKQFIDVDGEKVDLEQLKSERKKYLDADMHHREGSQMKREAQALYEQLENDPDAVFSNPHLSAKKHDLAMKWMRDRIEAELNPPDPRDSKLSEIEKRLKGYEAKEREAAETEEKQQYSKVVENRREAIASTLTKALELTPLSKDLGVQAEVLKEMAAYLRMARQDDRDVSPEELASHVQNNRMRSYHQLAQQLDGDELIDFLGEAIVNKMRKADLTRLRGKPNPPDTAEEQSWAPRDSNVRKREYVDPQSLRRR